MCATEGYGFAYTLGFILSPTTWADSAAKMEWKIIFSKTITGLRRWRSLCAVSCHREFANQGCVDTDGAPPPADIHRSFRAKSNDRESRKIG
jgi:hypothetical protein